MSIIFLERQSIFVHPLNKSSHCLRRENIEPSAVVFEGKK